MNNDNDNDNDYQTEGFDPVVDAIQSNLSKQSPTQLKNTIKTLQQRLIDYGYAPDLSTYAKKTELNPNSGKCLVSTAEDRDKYISKSDIPAAGPRIDLSQYVKKSSIPPTPACPSIPEIDYSQYVKKSTLPPNEKCPPCIAPKVKVSAGLCRECPPAPSCPPPQRCPEVKCPPPAPCPTLGTCTKCDEVRYIKVPTVITKTVMVDANGNIMSQQIDSGSNATPMTPVATAAQTLSPYVNNPTQAPTQAPTQSPTQAQSFLTSTGQSIMSAEKSVMGSIFGNPTTTQQSQIPSTTFPSVSTNNPNVILIQTLDTNGDNEPNKPPMFYPSAELNSEFKKYGIYGMP